MTRILLLLGLLAASLPLAGQKNSLAHEFLRHTLKEKLRFRNLDEIKQWLREHPSRPIHADQSTNNGVSDRANDILVSNNSRPESEVHAAINPTDTTNIITAAIWQDENNFLDPIDVKIYYSTNFGSSWQTSAINFNPTSEATGGGGDPVIAFDKSGKAYLSWLTLTIDFTDFSLLLSLYAATSTDKGASWSAPVLVDQGALAPDDTGGAVGRLVDKQWMAVDRSVGAYEGNLYICYTELNFIDSITATSNIILKRKAKTQNTFSSPAVKLNTGVYGIVQFSSIDVDPQGNVHVLFFGGNDDSDWALYHVVSTDGGQSFSPETKITDLFFPGLNDAVTNPIEGVAADRMYPCPHIAAGKTPGLLYAAWTATGITQQETSGYDIYFSKSTNNGQNWSTPVAISPSADPAAEQFYSAIFVNDNGLLTLSYYDRNDDPNGTQTDYVVIHSQDGGASFSTPNKANQTPSNFAFIGANNAEFGIGEYTQVVCSPYFAIPVWSDGRDNTGDIDIYAAILPIYGQYSAVQDAGTVTDAFSMTVLPGSEGVLNLEVTLKQASPYTLQLTAVDGKISRQQTQNTRQTGAWQHRLEAPSGVYFLTVKTDFGFKTKKVIIR